jgi:hypothetical protein
MVKCFECKNRIRVSYLVLRESKKVNVCADCYYAEPKAGA